MDNIEITSEYRRVLELSLRSGNVLFVTGKAGVGKSTMIKYLSSVLDNCVVVAPTAAAAINAGGETIHSFFSFPARHIDKNERFRLSDRQKFVIANMQTLIIDEASMVTPNIVDSIDSITRTVRKKNEPFGGISLVFVGDLLQLPPVVSSEQEAQYFKERYKHRFFFCADVFNEIAINVIELQKVRRQADPLFIEHLSLIREAKELPKALAYFNRNCFKSFEELKDPVWLVSTNAAAHSINSKKLLQLNGESRVYDARTDGEAPKSGWRLSVPEKLELKVGAKVVFVRNNRQKGWINGDTATILSLGSDTIVAKNDRSGEAVEVERMSWERYSYSYDEQSKQIHKDEVGSFTQFPLTLGWAVTIHKSQGMTLESAVIDFGAGTFSDGQAYVALSRCKSVQNLRLARALRKSDISASPEALEFYAKSGSCKLL